MINPRPARLNALFRKLESFRCLLPGAVDIVPFFLPGLELGAICSLHWTIFYAQTPNKGGGGAYDPLTGDLFLSSTSLSFSG